MNFSSENCTKTAFLSLKIHKNIMEQIQVLWSTHAGKFQDHFYQLILQV